MRYLPLTETERRKILDLCGVSTFEELTSPIPEKLRLKGLLDLEPELSEPQLHRHLKELAVRNVGARMQSHLGQGCWDHSWPSVIDQLTNRGEFLTAYTPYQPEISQGTLQCIFEFQSMVAELTNMEISNASLYDGATAALEAVLMAARVGGVRNGVVYVSEGTYEGTLSILRSCLSDQDIEVRTWWADPQTLTASKDHYEPSKDRPVIGFLMQSPNKWGLIEDWEALQQVAARTESKSIAYVSHPFTLAQFAPPGDFAVDLVCGELQPMGIPVGFGGPHLGFLACKRKDVRQLPGRLVGITEDAKGQQAFCVTLSTREQHIRREKATSNICSNQNLMAMRATMFMTLMGPEGLTRVSELCRAKAHYLREGLKEAFAAKHPKLRVLEGDAFNEVCVLVPQKEALWCDDVLSRAQEKGLLAGLEVEVPGASGFVKALSIAVTEKHEKADLDRLLEVLGA
jgi:glycine dehydrogenase subunit 1